MGQLLFKKCFWGAIRAGTKRTTLRRWDRPRVRAGDRAFAPGVGWLHVRAVEVVELDDLREADAQADGFASCRAMREALDEIYPHHGTDGKRWFRVAFEWGDAATSARPRQARRRGSR